MKYFDCPFCPLSDHGISLNCRLLFGDAETPAETVFETDNFIVVADAAPIRSGHALIVSRRHMTASLGENGKHFDELLWACAELDRRVYRPAGLHSLVWEHGSLCQESSPGCIEHAHLHVLPAENEAHGAIAALLGTALPVIADPRDFVARCAAQYIVLRDVDGTWYGLAADQVESQLLRRALDKASDSGLSSWQQHFHDRHIARSRRRFVESIEFLKSGGWRT